MAHLLSHTPIREPQLGGPRESARRHSAENVSGTFEMAGNDESDKGQRKREYRTATDRQGREGASPHFFTQFSSSDSPQALPPGRPAPQGRRTIRRVAENPPASSR